MGSFSPTSSDGLWFWTAFLVLVPPIVGCLVYILFKARNIIFALLKLLLVLLLVVCSPQWIGYLFEMLEWSPFIRPLMASCTLSFILYKLRLPGEHALKLGGRIIIWAVSGISLAKELIDSNGHLVSIGMLRVLAWIFCFGLPAYFPLLMSSSTRLGTAILDFVSLFIIWIDFANRTPFTLSLVIGHILLRLILRRRSPSLSSEIRYQNERTYVAAPSATSDYIYKPLDPEQKEFRLLTLLPGKSPRLSDPIECQIGHFPLGRSPPYVALSYQWGIQERTKEITLNGMPFKITASLDLALRRLRFHGIETLWVDAICINQSNNAERSIQVESMFTIYKCGKEVAVWLGTHDHGSSRVMDGLIHGKLKDFDDGKFNLLSPAEINQIDHFLSRTYWERVWIIQEIVAGKNVKLFCGQDIIHWENLERLGTEWPKYRPNMKPFQPVKTLCEIRASRRQLQTKTMGLVEILALTTHSKSTDPLDKVYGLLGLASDCDRFITMPDYNLSPTGLCLSMTNTIIIGSQSLDIILLGSKGKFQSPLPSWCPDFVNFQPSASDTALISYLSGEEKYRFGKLLRRWNTTANSRTLGSNIDITNETLTIPGLRIGTVHALGCTLNEDSSCLQQGTPTILSDSIDNSALFDSLSRIMMMYDEEFKFYGEFPVHLGWLMSWKYRIVSKMNGDAYSASVLRWLDSNRNLYIHGKTFSDWATSFRSSVQEAKNFGKGLFHASTKTLTAFTTEHLSRSIVEILEEGFRLMTCDHGRVGWAHKDCKIGDQIFLFGGCTLPVILRPLKRGKGYTLVGHAYIDGVMDNQVWGNRGVTSLNKVVIY